MAERSVELFATDDMMTRAEKITGLFIKGAVGDQVIAVYRILQTYEKLDREAATKSDFTNDQR